VLLLLLQQCTMKECFSLSIIIFVSQQQQSASPKTF
jgi:hypothetical protein